MTDAPIAAPTGPSGPPSVSAPLPSPWILVAVVVASGIVFLDSTIVNVALPRIGRELPSTAFGVLEAQAYITSGYLAVLAAFLVTGGALADRYGRRRIFATGLAGFGITSALCGIAPSMEALVLARLLQGMAGALLVPGSITIITASYQDEARARAFGLWAAATSALTLVGPLAGGLIVDLFSWRVAFLVNVPLVLLALWATLRHVPETRDERASGRIDWLGSIVVALAVGGLSFGLIRGMETDWSDPVAFGALAVGAVAAIAFPLLMLRRRDPLVPPALFRRRPFTVINLSTFLIYGALYTWSLLQTLYLQGVLGYTAVASAAITLPMAIFLTLGSTRVGVVANRIGPRRFLVAGPALMAAGLLWMARIPASSTPWLLQADGSGLLPPRDALVDVLPASLLFATGIMLVVAPLTTTLMASVPVRNAGVGSAINNAISRVGQPLIVALLFIPITAVFQGALASSAPSIDLADPAVRAAVQPLNPPPADLPPDQASAVDAASTDAFHLAMLVTALLLAGGAVVNGVGLPGGRLRPVDDEEGGDATAGAGPGGTGGAEMAGASPA
ncbi:MAG: MFS transporter [Chloroflexota bacterium]